MTRKLLSLVVVVGVLFPASASPQSPGGIREDTPAGQQQAQIFISAFQEILSRHRGNFNDSTLWRNALDGLVESLNDPYATVFTPAEVQRFDEDNTGNYSGIGVQISQLNSRVTITKVFRDTPADRAGLLEGDVIIGVGDNDASAWTTQMASDSIRGDEGSSVRVAIERPGLSVPMKLSLTRAQVHVPAVTGDLVEGTRIGYIAMDRVARGSAQEVDSVLRVLNGAQSLILDLRRNPGGFLDESLMISDVFLRPGLKLASIKSRSMAGRSNGNGDSGEESWTSRSAPRMPNAPIIVLVDEYTASAAEIVTGALQDHDRALVIGRRTFGKGIVQSVLDLPYGHKLRITTGSWHTPLGRSLQRDRDEGGEPAAENPDTFPRVRTTSGRELVAGGGIFPDIEIADDTLKTVERALFDRSAEKEIPIALRLQEFAFEEALRLRQTGASTPAVGEPTFNAFIAKLKGEGVPAELLDDPEVRSYLGWRARVLVADRMNALGSSVRARMDRDPVLTEALRLLQTARTQEDLYAAARRVNGTRMGSGQAGR
jgi:carboxyl-terminal processing protease